MPKALHRALKRSARKKGLKGKRAKRYVYGGLRNAAKKKRSRKR